MIGAVALLGSLGVRDARALWYCSPRRWAPFKADVLGEPDEERAPASGQRMTPAQPLEAREVAIVGHQLAAVLEGQRGEERVRHEIAGRPALPAQPCEDRPVARAGIDAYAVRLA